MMNSQDLFDGVTDIRDDLIDGAKEAPKKQKNRLKKRWMGAAATVLAASILGGIFLRPGGGLPNVPVKSPGPVESQAPIESTAPAESTAPIESTAPAESTAPGGELNVCAISQAEYPKMALYPSLDRSGNATSFKAWLESVQAQQRDLGDISPLQSFFSRSAQTFLAGAEGQNRVYSPLNVYMALSMLAQLTGGESREQILTLLGSDDMDALRQQASDVWNSSYQNDGGLTSILANSLWLDSNVNFNQDTMDILARDFYASSYQGKMGSPEFNKALQDWLNEQTGNLLKEQAGDIKLNSETILALASTLYFKAKWYDEFSEKSTEPQTFYTPAGDVEADFMHQRRSQTYYWGDSFTAVSQSFDLGGAMWFLLPEEGITPENLLSDSEALDFLFTIDKNKWEKQKYLLVNKYIPKFDVSSQFDLGKGLQELGITDVFDLAVADFTPVTTDVSVPIALFQANHAARVVIDEEGCTAAAFTSMASGGGAGSPDDKVDFVLNRPFIFCITGNNDLLLFVGIVNYPTGL